jgi:MinD-like ATPase involved in chromosome partitioning or flagellar assembly
LTPIDDMGGLDVLFGAPDLRRADGRLLTPALYRRIVATLRRTHDYVLVDTPVAEAVDHELFDDFVLRDSDRVLVVLDPNRETVQNNAEWLDIVGDPVSAGGRNVPAEKIGIVLNRAQDDGTWDAEAVSRYFRRYQFLGVVPQSAAVQQAADEGRLLEPFDPAIDRAVRRALAAVVDEPLLTADPERAGSGIDRFLARLFRR